MSILQKPRIILNKCQKLHSPTARSMFYLCCIVCLILAVFAWRYRNRQNVAPIPPVGGNISERFNFPIQPIYLQNDPLWGSDKLGNTHQSLASVGCTICSASMALSHYNIDIPPNILNNRLKAADGYTSRGWLKWKAISKVTDNAIKIEIPAQPSHSIIDKALSANQPVIAKLLINNQIWHWVLIVGKSGSEYLIKDPLGPKDTLVNLSKYKSNIYAIRIVKHIPPKPHNTSS